MLAVCAVLGSAQTGQPLPPWTPGTLDIHQISTGRGNSALFILPDGTTLLVDAGGAGDGLPQTEPHPDGSRRPGEWIARYVKRHLPANAEGLDYAMITHFHADHMGGLADVDAALPIRTLLDRGFPNYQYPAPLNDAAYRKLVTRPGIHTERFRPGAIQIRPLHEVDDFEIRNIIGNGDLWTGEGERTRQLFPALDTLAPADRPSENACSNAIRVRYGAFRYFTGGDLPGYPDPGFPAWNNLEAAIAPVVGHVDVHVVNQHGSMGEETDAYLQTLASTVIVIPSWGPSHPAPDVLKRIINNRYPPSPRFVFATEMREAARIVIGQRAGQLAGPTGHVVVRVEPAGSRYWVYVLDHRDERDLVVAVRGPFASRKN